MPTLKQISAVTGVSIETVSRVLNGQRKERWPGMKARASEIRRVALDLGYKPNSAARSMRSKKTHQVGVLIRNDDADPMTHLMSFEHILGLNEGLAEANYVLSLLRFGDVRQTIAEQSRALREKLLDAMVVFGGVPVDIVHKLAELFPKCVMMETLLQKKTRCIDRNEFQAGQLAARAVVAGKYRKLIFLNHPLDLESGPDLFERHPRLAGVKDVFASHPAIQLDVRTWTYGRPNTQTFIDELVRTISPDVAVLAHQAYQARFLSHALATRGVTAPRDFGLCSCDDGADISLMWPDLSRPSFDRYAMGKLAARMIIQQLEEPETPANSISVDSQWVPGATLRNTPKLPSN